MPQNSLLQRIVLIQNVRRPDCGRSSVPFHLEIAITVARGTGLFSVQCDAQCAEHDVIQIAHVWQIFHISALFAKYMDGAEKIMINDVIFFRGFHRLRKKTSGVFRVVLCVFLSFFLSAFIIMAGWRRNTFAVILRINFGILSNLRS